MDSLNGALVQLIAVAVGVQSQRPAGKTDEFSVYRAAVPELDPDSLVGLEVA
jgi:hypothetical protein